MLVEIVRIADVCAVVAGGGTAGAEVEEYWQREGGVVEREAGTLQLSDARGHA